MTSLNLFLAQGAGGGLSLLFPMIAMMGLMYFLMIRPQRQQQKKQEAMRSELSKSDKVITIGGVHGIVTGVTDKTVTVKVDEGVSIKFDRTAIASVVTND